MKVRWEPPVVVEESRAMGAAKLLAQLRKCPTKTQGAAVAAVEAWAAGGDEGAAIEALRKVVSECMAAAPLGADMKGQTLRAAVCDVFDDLRVKSAAEEAFE